MVKKVEFTIRDTSDNTIHKLVERYDDGCPLEMIAYMWEEDNMSCDCNRGLLIYDREFKCGEERFLLESIRMLAE